MGGPTPPLGETGRGFALHFSNHCHPSLHHITYLHIHLSAHGEVYIHPRPETDKTKLIILFHHIALFYVIAYTPCQRTSYLAHQYFRFVIAYYYSSAFILGR